MRRNYERDIYKQLTEEIDRSEKLQKENRQLREENRELRKEVKKLNAKISDIEGTMEEKLSNYVETAVKQAVIPLLEELTKAHAEISRLKAIINKDSSNSSKPPSTNGFKSIPNSREKSGKSQGGQKGHKGYRMKLPENLDDLEEQGIVERRLIDYTGGEGEYISKFTVDIEMKVIITEHRFLEGNIPGTFNNEVSYGDNIKAQVLLLMNEGIIAHKRLSGIISGLTHDVVKISTGTMNKFKSDFADNLTKSRELEAIKHDLLNGEVMNTDDTSMRVLERIVYSEVPDKKEKKISYELAEKKSFRATLRTHSNEKSTLYTVNPKKDMDGVERDGILSAYQGILSHDHEAKFFNYGKDNSSCGGHLSRELKGLSDSYNCLWATEMRKFILGMNEYKNEDLAKGSSCCDPEKLAGFEMEYDKLVAQGCEKLGQMAGGEWGRKEFCVMLNRLADHKNSYMLFIRNYKVPFTNNLAERDLRGQKTKEKVSGLFRSWKGIEDHAKIHSFMSTLKKRGKNLLHSIKQVIRHEPVLT